MRILAKFPYSAVAQARGDFSWLAAMVQHLSYRLEVHDFNEITLGLVQKPVVQLRGH